MSEFGSHKMSTLVHAATIFLLQHRISETLWQIDLHHDKYCSNHNDLKQCLQTAMFLGCVQYRDQKYYNKIEA